MFKKPKFKEYVLARVVTAAVLIFIMAALLLIIFVDNIDTAYIAVLIIALSFSIFVFMVANGAKKMQNELNTISLYLDKLNKLDAIDYKVSFFTSEFEEIKNNFEKALLATKKSERKKSLYNAKLKLKNRQRADMISAISHEFRNPIASIMGYAETLNDEDEIPTMLRKKFLKKIYNNSTKIEALLSRLVLWNRFESGETKLDITSFDLVVLIEDIKVSLYDKYPKRAICLKCNSIKVKADRTLMEVVLKNLIENALKYSTEEVFVKLKGSRVSVVDSGSGISAEDINKVTKKFYRSGAHSWDNSMGLGLSIVKRILTLHNTKLEIESQKDKGSTFSFTI